MSPPSPAPQSSLLRGSTGLTVALSAATLTFGGLAEVERLYHETGASHDTTPGRSDPAAVQLLHPFP
ncbi:MAG: hypothetical protein KGL52_04780 [Rhodospirillales bacterium]|nr:hypothetical protein [Rhodospirillales bacterium]